MEGKKYSHEWKHGGEAVYFIGQATTFWLGVLGFLKVLVWPAFLVYEALKFLLR